MTESQAISMLINLAYDHGAGVTLHRTKDGFINVVINGQGEML